MTKVFIYFIVLENSTHTVVAVVQDYILLSWWSPVEESNFNLFHHSSSNSTQKLG